MPASEWLQSPACANWLEVGALGLHRAPKVLYSEGLMKVPWKEPASNRLYGDAPSTDANLFLLSQVQYSPSLPDDKLGKILSFTRGRGNKLTGTFDPEAWLRGATSAVFERELEQESQGNKTQAFTKIHRLQGRDVLTSQRRHDASINTWTLRVENTYTHAVVHTYTYMYVYYLFFTCVY